MDASIAQKGKCGGEWRTDRSDMTNATDASSQDRFIAAKTPSPGGSLERGKSLQQIVRPHVTVFRGLFETWNPVRKSEA
jgi:hypothetical protein